MARLGFDVDHVTYKFFNVLRDYIHEETGKPIEDMPDPETWLFMTENWNLTMDDYKKFVRDGVNAGKIFWRGPLYDDCLEVIKELKYHYNHDIIFVTARALSGIENLCKYATQYWLNNVAGIPYDELYIVGATDSKVGHDIDVLFDDAPDHLIEFTQHGEHVVAFDQLWNEHVTDVPRVYGWTGIFDYVDANF